jgi:hypothetical protein
LRARRAAIAALALAALALPGGASPARACGCGIALESTVSDERALVVETPGHERIVLSLDLAGDPGGRPAIVLPVPGVPEVEAIEHGDPLAYLDTATTRPDPGAVGGAAPDATAAAPVDVIGRETVGGYDVARLASGDPAALDRWLRRNGYALPDGAEPILADYVDRGWRFVAVRLAPGDEGRLKPLDVSFAAESPVYPMRLEQLASTPVDLTLYVLADGPRAVDGLQTAYEGSVSGLEPQPPPALAELFAEGSEVTRLEASGVSPASFTEDLAIESFGEPAGDEPAGASDSNWEKIGAIAAAVALMAFAIFAVLTRPDKGATSIDGTDAGP